MALFRTTAFCSLIAALTLVSATIAAGQTDTSVVLHSNSSDTSVVGELVDVVDGKFHLRTNVGILTVSIDSVTCVGAACPPLVPTFEKGAQIALTTKDGSMNISGSIQDFADGTYTILAENLGTFHLDASLVNCTGPGCPKMHMAGMAQSATETPGEAIPLYAVRVDPSVAKVRFAGSDTVGLGLMPFLLEDYAAYLNATADIAVMSDTETYVRYLNASGTEVTSLFVNATGSGEAFDALEVKAAEFGMTSRPAKDSEAARIEAAGGGNPRDRENETVIAVDSLAVITHPSNPVKDLTTQEIGGMYLGQITNWSEVGGPNAPITVLSREDGSSTRGVFETAIFSGDEPTLGQRVSYPGGDNPEMAEAVRRDPNAIGYVGFAFSEGLNRLDLTSSCGITSTATPFAVKTEEYPLGRRLYLYTRPDNMPPEAQKFLDYLLSPDADDAIAQSSFVNFAVERTDQSTSRLNTLFDDLRTQSEVQLADQFRDDLGLWDRLSTTIRFSSASATLGKKEQNDIARLISYLEAQPAGTRVAIVGFTDSVGPFEENRRLSGNRALSVAQAIADQAGDRLPGVEFVTKAYSELSPSVCNTDENGRAINRRVEIWQRR